MSFFQPGQIIFEWEDSENGIFQLKAISESQLDLFFRNSSQEEIQEIDITMAREILALLAARELALKTKIKNLLDSLQNPEDDIEKVNQAIQDCQIAIESNFITQATFLQQNPKPPLGKCISKRLNPIGELVRSECCMAALIDLLNLVGEIPHCSEENYNYIITMARGIFSYDHTISTAKNLEILFMNRDPEIDSPMTQQRRQVIRDMLRDFVLRNS